MKFILIETWKDSDEELPKINMTEFDTFESVIKEIHDLKVSYVLYGCRPKDIHKTKFQVNVNAILYTYEVYLQSDIQEELRKIVDNWKE